MSARIRASSLFSRNYDWIFCESIKPQRPRALHSHKLNEALLRMRKVLSGSRPARRQPLRISKVATGAAKPISKIRTKPGSKAEEVRIHRVAVDASVRQSQLIRAVTGGSRLGTSGRRISGNESENGRKEAVITGKFEGSNKIPPTVRRVDATEGPATFVRLLRRARFRNQKLQKTAVKQDSCIESQEVRIGRYQTREEDPHKQTFRLVKHLAKDPENPPVFKPGRRRRLRGVATTATKTWKSKGEEGNLRVFRYRTRKVDPHKLVPILKVPTRVRIRKIGGSLNMEKLPEGPLKPKPAARKPLQSRLKPAESAIPLQPPRKLSQPDAPVKSLNLEQAQGLIGTPTESAEPSERIDRNQVRHRSMDPEALKRPSNSARAKSRKNVLKNQADALQHGLLRTASLKVRTHLSVALKDRPFGKSEAQKAAEQDRVSKLEGTLQIAPGPRIIKTDSVRLRKHISERPTFAQPVIDFQDSRFEQPVMISGLKSFAIPDVVSGVDPLPPTTISRVKITNLVSEAQYHPRIPATKLERQSERQAEKLATKARKKAERKAETKANKAKRRANRDNKKARKEAEKVEKAERKAQRDKRIAKKEELEQTVMIRHPESLAIPDIVSAGGPLSLTAISRVKVTDLISEAQNHPLIPATKLETQVEEEAEKEAERKAQKEKRVAEKDTISLKEPQQTFVIREPESLVIPDVVSAGDPLPLTTIRIRRAMGFDSVPEGTGQPLAVKRPKNLVVRKVNTIPIKEIPDPENPTDSPLIKGYMSTTLYPIPTAETKMFSEFELEREPMEKIPPAVTHHLDPAERIAQAVELASSKRLQRESWLTRKGDMRLAISLLFSPRSMANVQRLRWKYNPNKEKFANFKVLRRLEIGRYNEYATMLASFVQTWEPFTIKLNEPGHTKDKRSSFKVGLKLEFEKLEQLEKALLESVKSLPGRAEVNRRNTRDNDELGLLVIDGKIKGAQDAANLVELLKNEHGEGLGSLRAEGLVLHGYAKGGDSLFPPPKQFLFPAVKGTI